MHVALVSLFSTVVWRMHSTVAQQPNIVFFMVDDMQFSSSWSVGAPDGYELEGQPTPTIDQFMSESVVFSRAYAAAPKCAPSRFAVLTGRYPTRSEHARDLTLSRSNGEFTTKTTVPYSKMYNDDQIYNLPNTLRTADRYYTGMCGKWHLNGDDGGLDCDALNSRADFELYTACLDIVKAQGWDWADAIFEGNIDASDYSHNPEWMVSQAQKFIDTALDVEEKPFFLHFATTLTHAPDIETALESFNYLQSPKGELTGDDVPDDTTMPSRADILATTQAWNEAKPGKETNTADYVWLDATLAALIDYLQERGVYDNTFFVFMNDHGMFAKSVLYEAGTRMLMMVRYPPLFGVDGPYVMPSTMIVSNVDLAATVFALSMVTVDDNYVLDGTSWLDDVVDAIADEDHESTCCQVRYMDMVYSHAIVSDEFQYVYRLTPETDADYPDIYPSFYETEQLYNLLDDPLQQSNLVDMWEYESKLFEMEQLMDEYIKDICPVDTCTAPMRFAFP